jgi:membrane fusion protein (multidrug efflux system)
MKILFVQFIIIASSLVLFYSCNTAASNSSASFERVEHNNDPTEVQTIILTRQAFAKELSSTGRLSAIRKTEVRFKISGTVEELNIKNGSVVKKGTVLARLDKFDYQQELDQASSQVNATALEMEDLILGYVGLKSKDSISSKLREAFSSKSGYTQALLNYESAKFRLESTLLKSPFEGKVANLNIDRHDLARANETLCLIIDDSEFEVDFSILESEIPDVNLGDSVSVMPFGSARVYRGKVTEINPFVSENGLVKVKARLVNTGKLWEGMNVKIVIAKSISALYVVPKEAVVLRQNQQVLFKYVSGKASWIYVETLMENSRYYSITLAANKSGTLSIGDTIIVNGSLNLAHNSEVRLR